MPADAIPLLARDAILQTRLLKNNPVPLDEAAIVEAATAGDPTAQGALDRYLDRLARGLAVIADIADPDVFVLGGGMSNVELLYERLPALVAPHVFTDRWESRILKARWGDSSGVRGAARLWAQADWAGDVAA